MINERSGFYWQLTRNLNNKRGSSSHASSRVKPVFFDATHSLFNDGLIFLDELDEQESLDVPDVLHDGLYEVRGGEFEETREGRLLDLERQLNSEIVIVFDLFLVFDQLLRFPQQEDFRFPEFVVLVKVCVSARRKRKQLTLIGRSLHRTEPAAIRWTSTFSVPPFSAPGLSSRDRSARLSASSAAPRQAAIYSAAKHGIICDHRRSCDSRVAAEFTQNDRT